MIRRSIFRLVVLSVSLAIVIGTGSPAASAESPDEVAEVAADDGVFIGVGRGNDVDEDALIRAVEDARSAGLELVAVVPADPQPTASAFARRVQEAMEVDAALVFPPDGRLETFAIDDLSAARARATARARDVSEPAQAVEAFAAELNSDGGTERAPIVGRIIAALLVFLLIVGGVVAVEQKIKRKRAPAETS